MKAQAMSSSNEEIHTYIEHLQGEPKHGAVMSIRITNKRSISLAFQIEPTGDITDEPLAPNDSFVVVAQGDATDYGTLDIEICDDEVRVWVEGRDGQIFHNGESVAY
jgi:hypothetical protein